MEKPTAEGIGHALPKAAPRERELLEKHSLEQFRKSAAEALTKIQPGG